MTSTCSQHRARDLRKPRTTLALRYKTRPVRELRHKARNVGHAHAVREMFEHDLVVGGVAHIHPAQAVPAADARQQALQRLPAPFLEQDQQRQQAAAQAREGPQGPVQQMAQEFWNDFGPMR